MENIITPEKIKKVLPFCTSISEICRQIGVADYGGAHQKVKELILKYNLDTSTLCGRSVRKINAPIKHYHISEILVKDSKYTNNNKLKKRIFEERLKKECCEHCGITEWNGKPIIFELHHINGDRHDNRMCNLIVLCPNCHSQTHNFRGANSKTNYYENDFREKLQQIANENAKNNPIPNKPIKEKKSKPIKILEPKYCLCCGKELVGKEYRGKYCSVECYREHTTTHIPKVPELIEKFKELKSFRQVGKYYGVSDNAAKKWCKKYGILDMIEYHRHNFPNKTQINLEN